jgi:hypothetical protein
MNRTLAIASLCARDVLRSTSQRPSWSCIAVRHYGSRTKDKYGPYYHFPMSTAGTAPVSNIPKKERIREERRQQFKRGKLTVEHMRINQLSENKAQKKPSDNSPRKSDLPPHERKLPSPEHAGVYSPGTFGILSFNVQAPRIQ